MKNTVIAGMVAVLTATAWWLFRKASEMKDAAVADHTKQEGGEEK